jgi:cytochrome c553
MWSRPLLPTAFACLLIASGQTRGEDLAQPPSEIAEQAALCAGCHGPDGLPVVEDVPIIAGQHMFYLLTQLRDFAAERRASDIMSPMAAALSDDEMKALATYFSEQAWPAYHDKATDAEVARAKTLAVEGQCTQCHLGGMVGDSRNPRLSNQKVDYAIKTTTDFRDNARMNAPAMAAIVRGWSDEDITAMAKYLAGL